MITPISPDHTGSVMPKKGAMISPKGKVYAPGMKESALDVRKI
jgi:hypothetical protein